MRSNTMSGKDDCISRQMALDAIKAWYAYYPLDMQEPIDDCWNSVRELPAVQPDAPDANVGNITNSCAHENDAVSRQMAIDAMKDLTRFYDGEVVARQLIDEQPTVDSERKTGRWIYGEHDISMCDGYRCDKCGFFVPWDYHHKSIDFINDYHFCPSCGADMRGIKEHE